MPVSLSTVLLIVINVALLWLLMAAPVGKRTLVLRRFYPRSPEALWRAIHPLGADAGWHPSVVDRQVIEPGRLVSQSLKHLDRKGQPIRRTLEVTDTAAQGNTLGVTTRIVEDSTLDASFWSSYSETRRVEPAEGGAMLVIEQTDRYKGLAFLIFRYFAMRREMRALGQWFEQGKAELSGWFEHPITQVLMAILSTLILWPFFGFGLLGLILSSQLTIVIVLHELGHMAAYRAFGHKTARMIVLPLLGGIAIGGRPYNSRFEVATCALMGPGLSAFFVPIIIGIHAATVAGHAGKEITGVVLTLLLVLGAFNILNLLPMYRFDGGQVLRQLFSGTKLVLASFAVTAMLAWLGWRIHMPAAAILSGLAIFTLLSLWGGGSFKPREALTEMTNGERLLAAFGLYATLAIHAYAVIYATDMLFPG